MQDLFQEAEDEIEERVSASAPLAARMRPRTLDEFVGQEHILAPGKLLRRAIEADRLPSLILFLGIPHVTQRELLPNRSGLLPWSKCIPQYTHTSHHHSDARLLVPRLRLC